MHATVAEFDKFEVFVDELVAPVEFRELLLDETFHCLDASTEGRLNPMVVLFLFLGLLGEIV